MASEPSSPINRPYRVPDCDLDPEDPFHTLLLNNPDLPRARYGIGDNGPGVTKCWYKSWEGRVVDFNFDKDQWPLPRGPGGRTEGTIMIQTIDKRAISMLKREFPDLNLHFLHQHAARLETPMPLTNMTSQTPLIRLLSPDKEDSDDLFGLHFDGCCSPSFTLDGQNVRKGSRDMPFSFCHGDQAGARLKYRTELFVRFGPAWYRSSTRISCCMLSPTLYLVLTDSPLQFRDYPHINIRDTGKDSSWPALAKDPWDGVVWRGFEPITTLLRTFDHFLPHEVLNLMSTKATPGVRLDATFHCLLVVSDWQFLVDRMECMLRELQSLASGSLDKTTLDDMGSFRRILAAARESIADNETQMLLATGMATKRNVGGLKSQDRRTVQYHFQEVNISSGGVFSPRFGNDEADTETLDAATLLDKLAQLEDRLGVIAKTVNEEIQLFIASVSIRDSEVMLADSKIMREDSHIMKQQAARTTLLTTLAVIYLPLQLITGIFGMNITEITGDGRLRWWACLATLAAGGVLTFLVYLAVKWWQWRDSQHKAREGDKEKEA